MMEIEVLADNRNIAAMPKFMLAHWLVEPSVHRITHLETGEQRSLEPRLMHLLCLLASESRGVQTREHLIKTIWPKVIVNENSLTRAVSELRKKLDHPSHSQCVIETIPKQGYRLTVQCQAHADAQQPHDRAAETEAVIANSEAANYWQAGISRLSVLSRSVAAGAFALFAFIAFASFYNTSETLTPLVVQRPLADINISGADALNSLIRARMDTVASSNGGAQLGVSNSECSQPIVSRDGRLFAQIRYSDEGSSLLLGSTDLPNSPVAVLSTQDFIYNLQWSPVDRALLFAQSPRLTNAALLLEEQASLVMFDIDSFSTRVIQGPAASPHEDGSQAEPHNFKLTSLAKHLDWLS